MRLVEFLQKGEGEVRERNKQDGQPAAYASAKLESYRLGRPPKYDVTIVARIADHFEPATRPHVVVDLSPKKPIRSEKKKVVLADQEDNFATCCSAHGKKIYRDSHGWRGRKRRQTDARARRKVIRLKRVAGLLWLEQELSSIVFKEECMAALMQPGW